MSSKKITPNTTSQKTGDKFQTFKDLKNVKTVNNKYAVTELVHGKSKPLNRPSTVTVSNFKAGLPTGSLITKIQVKYKHEKVAYNNNVCNIPAPTITLMNGLKEMKYSTGKVVSKKGEAPEQETSKKKIVENTVTFKRNWSHSEINKKDFGVRIDYPTNTNDYDGYIRLYYVELVVTYKVPSFGLSISKLKGGVNGDDYSISVTCSNKNGVNYDPPIIISVPVGFSLKDRACNGKLVINNNRTFTWTPKFSTKIQSETLTLTFSTNVIFPSGGTSYTGVFEVQESLTGIYKPHNAIISKESRITDSSETGNNGAATNTGDPNTQGISLETIYAVQGQYSPSCFIELTEEDLSHNKIHFKIAMENQSDSFTIWYNPHPTSPIHLGTTVANPLYAHTMSINSNEFEDRVLEYKLRCSTLGRYKISVYYSYEGAEWVNWKFLKSFYLSIIPSVLTLPYIKCLSLTNEELLRLGDGVSYICQSFIKVVSNESYVRDWRKNFRIGIFNNAISENLTITTETDSETGETIENVTDSTDYSNLSIQDIFNHAEYWSPCLTSFNEFENIECHFVYNKNYPLYILITGDYIEGTPSENNLSFSEPCIIEDDSYYKGWESNGIFPVSIDDLVLNDNSSELTLPELTTTNRVICYQLPLDDDYGTNTDIAVRGLEVRGNIEKSDEDIILRVKLRNSKNESRERSIILNEYDTDLDSDHNFSVGGMGDLWGFSTLDITNLQAWEIEITPDNTINNHESYLNIGNLEFVIYVQNIEHQKYKCYIEDEDLSYYGVFLTDVIAPEGLNTDTKYLKIDGTDTNEPTRQNITEKKITLEFDIGDSCDLEYNTLILRELTRLLVNKRDEYNRPIPKKIEFDHYPDVYWEYILEKTLDNKLEINDYSVKLDLTIPAGTAFAKNKTITNNTGYVSGVASINPVIIFRPVSGANIIQINEELSNQSFNMGYDDWENGYVEIDCENQKATLLENSDDEIGKDISEAVDWTSDWFRLIEDYFFTSVNCDIHSIAYRERW